jgi:hypothetical protein
MEDKLLTRVALFDDASEAWAVSISLSNDELHPTIVIPEPVEGKVIDEKKLERDSEQLRKREQEKTPLKEDTNG